MSTKEKEKALVDKFILGSVRQKSVLNLKQLNRKIRVADILDIKYIGVEAKKYDSGKKVTNDLFKDLGNNFNFDDIFGGGIFK